MKLGRKVYQVYRDDGAGKAGDYVDGEWVDSPRLRSVKIRATIQPATASNLVRMNIQGEREADAVWIDSNQKLFMPRSQTLNDNLQADIVEYDGARWEVRKAIWYDSIPSLAHCEAVAFKMNDSIRSRDEELCC